MIVIGECLDEVFEIRAIISGGSYMDHAMMVPIGTMLHSWLDPMLGEFVKTHNDKCHQWGYSDSFVHIAEDEYLLEDYLLFLGKQE
jgi:hypothetical protein